MIRHSQPRSAFTLVELLVAMSLAVVILALAVGVSQSSAFESYKVTGSADRLTQWLLVAKNKALRDKAPRGIRLLPENGSSTATLYREVAYIEQPEPIPSNGSMLVGGRLNLYYPAVVTEVTMPAPSFTVTHTVASRKLTISGLTTAKETELINAVQAGDFISIPELRVMMKLTAAPSGSAPVTLSVDTLSLPDLGQAVYSVSASSRDGVSPHPNYPVAVAPNDATLSISTYGIIRAPRPLLGEPTQQLPSGMAIDITNSLDASTADSLGNRDILFAPSGEVVAASSSITALLMRDTNLSGITAPLTTDYDKAGQMILICIYNRTGAIATQPVAPPPTNSYQYARDGINTGL